MPGPQPAGIESKTADFVVALAVAPTRRCGENRWSQREVEVNSLCSRPPPTIMPFRQRGSMLGSLLGILVCGVGGGLAAWAAVTALGIAGVPGAILAAVTGMVVATALWAGGTTLFRALGWVR